MFKSWLIQYSGNIKALQVSWEEKIHHNCQHNLYPIKLRTSQPLYAFNPKIILISTSYTVSTNSSTPSHYHNPLLIPTTSIPTTSPSTRYALSILLLIPPIDCLRLRAHISNSTIIQLPQPLIKHPNIIALFPDAEGLADIVESSWIPSREDKTRTIINFDIPSDMDSSIHP